MIDDTEDIQRSQNDSLQRLVNAIDHIRNVKILSNPSDAIEPELSDSIWRAADAAQVEVEQAMNIIEAINNRT
jgi:hypothetical protein